MRFIIAVWKKSGEWVKSASSGVGEYYVSLNSAYRDRNKAAALNSKVKGNRYIVVDEDQDLSDLPPPK